MDADTVDEAELFAAIEGAGVRWLLIGRRALIALGMPVLTADYDLWLHIDDIEKLNLALEPLDLFPNLSPAEARGRGRYVFENGEHIDVLVARGRSTKDGVELRFDDAWSRHERLEHAAFVLRLPVVEDLITTKRWGMRERDLLDIRYLETLMAGGKK